MIAAQTANGIAVNALTTVGFDIQTKPMVELPSNATERRLKTSFLLAASMIETTIPATPRSAVAIANPSPPPAMTYGTAMPSGAVASGVIQNTSR